jgi:hypothetical protein
MHGGEFVIGIALTHRAALDEFWVYPLTLVHLVCGTAELAFEGNVRHVISFLIMSGWDCHDGPRCNALKGQRALDYFTFSLAQ